jgi:hypothetical protein
VKKLLLAIGFPAIAISVATLAATSAAWSQAYGYWGAPYTYGMGLYDYSGMITAARMRRHPMLRLPASVATTPTAPPTIGTTIGSTDQGEATTSSRRDKDRFVRS